MACNKTLTAKMSHRITLETVTQSPDGQGGFNESWDAFTSVWASIEPVKAYEKFQAAQMQTPISHKIIIRYLEGLTNNHRINFGGRILEIKEILNVDESNSFMKITALERA
jgi:SPP1 family predicted phage head-tail adaptor